MTDHFGVGIRIDRHFDLDVDPSGDLAYDHGDAEIRKDIALAVAEVLTTGSTERLGPGFQDVTIPDSIQSGVIGEFISDGILKDVAILVSNVLTADPRIERIGVVSANLSEEDRNEIVIDATMTALTAEDAEAEDLELTQRFDTRN